MAKAALHTYSIVGRCVRTGEVGAAVASAVPAVGAICLYGRAGVGCVSTQSWVNPYLAVAALDALAKGAEAAEALATALADDSAAAFRQIGVIGRRGGGAVHTGAECTSWAGERSADDHAALGNMLTGPEVLEAMSASFAALPNEPLEERLMCALEAAQRCGGDKRGRQSAGLLVCGTEIYPRVDLRVDEHVDPVRELRRVLSVATAQLAPFVAGMPRRDEPPAPPPEAVVDMLLMSPPDRPGGGGSRNARGGGDDAGPD
jgi:uncharacterized Ntn-hydrolase superfamily protein